MAAEIKRLADEAEAHDAEPYFFELGKLTYIVYKSSGSEGYRSTLYRVTGHAVEEVADYCIYVMVYNFWNTRANRILRRIRRLSEKGPFGPELRNFAVNLWSR